tara:strand:- start:733 stop:2031 length:1299 start_codon:yes stop_codon:yes gene_type:complete
MKFIFKFIIKIFIKLNLYYILSLIFIFFCKRKYKKNIKKKSIIILSSDDFRNELTFFEKSFNFIESSKSIQTIFFDYFFEKERGFDLATFYNLDKNKTPDLFNKRERFQNFLEKIIPRVINFYKIDLLVMPHFKYITDVDFCDVFRRNNVKIICIFKESLSLVSNSMYNVVKKKYSNFLALRIDDLIVYNNRTKKLFEEAGCYKKKIKVLGSPRMYNLMQNFKKNNHKKSILLLSFDLETSFYGKDIDRNYDSKFGKKLFFDIHGAYLKLIKKYPNFNFKIRPKPKFVNPDSIWSNLLKELFAKEKFNPKEYKNFKIDKTIDFHESLENTSICCGIQSTAILEASIVGIPVILTLFSSFKKSKYFDEYSLKKNLSLFEQATNLKELEYKIKKVLGDEIDKDILDGRKELFNKEVSTIDQNVINNYNNFFNNH